MIRLNFVSFEQELLMVKMKVLIAVFFLTCTVVVQAGRMFPTISIPENNKWPKSKVYVRNADPQSFSCQAKTPARYRWTFNGTKVENVSMVTTVFESNGTLRIGQSFKHANSGDYQCFAENDHGTTMTPIIQILGTIAEAFKSSETDTSTVVKAHVSKYFKMECKHVPLSVPQWTFKWEKGNFVGGKLDSDQVNDPERLIVDRQGFLHFIWTEATDGNFIYACAPRNTILLVTVRNTETISLTIENGNQPDRIPELVYSQNQQVYEGEDAELMCIFTYFSVARERITIEWYRFGELIGTGRKLELLKVNQSHDGEYICNATLGGQTTQPNFVILKVVAPPKFIAEPHSKDLQVGSDVVLLCNTTSHYSYTQPPVWFLNAVPLIGCPDHHFECKTPKTNGFSECIHEKKVCNSFPDCSDSSDEGPCPGRCSEGQTWCNGNCMPEASPCNELICNFPKFKCHNTKNCINKDQKCDGNRDCPDGSDEIACSGGNTTMRNRFELNSDRTQLTLRNVQLKDSACLQCLVRNDFGSSIVDACLTMIDKIKLVRGPKAIYSVVPGMVLDIYAEATTDELWQNQMYIWQWYEEGPVDRKTGQITTKAVTLPPIGPYGRYFGVNENGKHLAITFPEVKEDDQDLYNVYYTLKDRVYTLIIKHDYDQIEVNFTIDGVEIIKPSKIKLMKGPNATYSVVPDMALDIYVEATTDEQWQNQMLYIWQWYEKGPVDKKTGQTSTKAVTLPPKGPYARYFGVNENGKHLVINFPEVKEDDQDMYNVYYTLKDRVYTLIIKHDYDQIKVNFTIDGLEIMKPSTTGTPLVETAATNLYIAIILPILILLIVVAVIVCYMYRKRGGTYPRDKKKQQAGEDPAQELKCRKIDEDKPRAGDCGTV